jgi:hypothetical protein
MYLCYEIKVMSAQLAFGLLVSTASIRLFTTDELVRHREEVGGIAIVPVYLGKITGAVFEFMFFAFAFLCSYYSVVNTRAPFYDHLKVFIVLHLAISGLTNLITVTFEVNN